MLLVLLSRFLTLSAMALYAASLGTTALAAYQETASLKQRAQIGLLNEEISLCGFKGNLDKRDQAPGRVPLGDFRGPEARKGMDLFNFFAVADFGRPPKSMRNPLLLVMSRGWPTLAMGRGSCFARPICARFVSSTC